MTNDDAEAPEGTPGDGESAAPLDEAESDAELTEAPDAESEDQGPTADEAQQYLDDLQRITAEFANYRRQAEKRNIEASERAAISVIEALLPVLDACDQATDLGSTDVEPIRSLLIQTLEREGVVRFDATGEVFDPKHHEAVMTEALDDDESLDDPVVVEVMRAGYSFGGVVIRAAMVKVRG